MGGIFFYYLYLLLFWGFVRNYVTLPEVVEELWLKPVVWLVPLMLWNFTARKRVVMFESEGWFRSIFLGLIVGLFYVFSLNGFSFDKINLDINYFGIAVSTAIVEELVFSGFVYKYLSNKIKTKSASLLIASLMAVGSYIPIVFFMYSMSFGEAFPSLLLIFGYSLINISICASTRNVIGSMLARVILILSVV